MNKKEFLAVLQECLEGELPSEEIKSNIAYYKDYIESNEESEKTVLEQLGDPRLIARTIINSYQANKGPMAGYYKEQARNEYSQTKRREEHSQGEEQFSFMFNGRNLKWYEKLAAVFMVIVVLAVIYALLVTVTRVVLWILPIVIVGGLAVWLISYITKGR